MFYVENLLFLIKFTDNFYRKMFLFKSKWEFSSIGIPNIW